MLSGNPVSWLLRDDFDVGPVLPTMSGNPVSWLLREDFDVGPALPMLSGNSVSWLLRHDFDVRPALPMMSGNSVSWLLRHDFDVGPALPMLSGNPVLPGSLAVSRPRAARPLCNGKRSYAWTCVRPTRSGWRKPAVRRIACLWIRNAHLHPHPRFQPGAAGVSQPWYRKRACSSNTAMVAGRRRSVVCARTPLQSRYHTTAG
jgi:hypothetical protein